MKVLFSNYHISVNRTLVDDLVAIGMELIMPADHWSRISFFAPNDEHMGKARLVSFSDYMSMEPMIMLIPCTQMVQDMVALWHERARRT